MESTRLFFDWWHSFLPDLPRRSDFDILEHRYLIQHVYVIQVLGPGDYLYRLNGEKVIGMVGKSMRLTPFSLTSPQVEDQLLARYMDRICTARHAMRCRGNLAFAGRGFSNFESVDCPFTDETGTITHIIGVMKTIPQDRAAPPAG
nr:PAS domain-containing protein [Sneathiella chinensis]